ncbi:hypothetical protein [Limimaricola hongkongensis]|uniref:hypothetical protein n=1 Tax=Limimaricola hongkongensis TaxID=278132 RepID=UPI000381D2DC|nr:hypothetical protein [Limimaricola hongkongensis]
MNVTLPEIAPQERAALQLSVLVSVEGAPDLPGTLEMYRPVLSDLKMSYEVLCVVDARDEQMMTQLAALERRWPELTILGQRPWLDEDAGLLAAVKRSRGDRVLTLAGWPEVAPADIAALVGALDHCDMAVAARRGRAGSMRQSALRAMLRTLFGRSVSDLFCRTRAARRPALAEASAFGVRQHFLPAIGSELGYTVTEIDVDQPPADARGAKFVFKPLGHLRALFDALTLFMVLKFLRRPLRFFGAVGLPVFLLGMVITTVYLVLRIFADVPLADRPGLIFAVLMVVLGLQVIALGLIGEIIIYAHSRRLTQYSVKSVIRKEPAR